MSGRIVKKKSDFIFARISPFRMTAICQSTGNLFSKVLCVDGPTSGKIFRRYSPLPLKSAGTVAFL
jgi:hypothetical protein